jgi:hypothetical protein
VAYCRQSVSTADVYSYYKDSLPQLGWRTFPAEIALFRKGADILAVQAQPDRGRIRLSLQVQPQADR